MKVMMVSTNADLSGAPLHVLELAKGMSHRGIDVVVVVGKDGSMRKLLDKEGIPTETIPQLASTLNIAKDLIVLPRLFWLIRKHAPDIIHAHSTKAGMVARIVGWVLRKPVVFTVHGWGFGAGRKRLISALVYAIERLLKHCTAHFITVSNRDRRVGIREVAIPEHAIVTIHNGVSFAEPETAIAHDCRRLIMVARQAFPKDYTAFLHALTKVDFDSALLVGEGTDDPDFVAEVRRLTGEDSEKIHCLGIRQDIRALLQDSGIFVLATHFEGLPLAIIEAMSQGLPVIASDVGGIPELVAHGKTGLLFPAGDHRELARHLETLMGDPQQCRKMGAKALKRYRAEFRAERMIEQVHKVYLSIAILRE